MLKIAAIIFGAAFLLAGLLGFIPAAAPNGMLLGVLHVNAAHNVVHLITVVVALLAAYTGIRASQLFFQVSESSMVWSPFSASWPVIGTSLG